MQKDFSQVIAIDGPAASGKSTVALAVARELGCPVLNSGALYRLVTWACLQRCIDCSDFEAVAGCVPGLDLRIDQVGLECHPCLDSVFLSQDLRAPAVTAHVAVVASVPVVRHKLTTLMREFAASRHLVVEGRDIGSVVFPDARHKFYLHADLAVRQARRQREGHTEDIEKRDTLDRSRQQSPLKVPDAAVIVDTSTLAITEVVQAILANLRQPALMG